MYWESVKYGCQLTYNYALKKQELTAALIRPLDEPTACSIFLGRRFRGLPKSINQSIKTRDAQASLGHPDRCLCCDGHHRRLSSATQSNDDIDWPVHSLMLSFHDLRGLPLRCHPSTEPCSMIFGSVSCRQTRPNHDKFRKAGYLFDKWTIVIYAVCQYIS